MPYRPSHEAAEQVSRPGNQLIGMEERMIKRPAVLLSAILILGLGFNYGAWAQAAAPEATQVQRDGDGESH